MICERNSGRANFFRFLPTKTEISIFVRTMQQPSLFPSEMKDDRRRLTDFLQPNSFTDKFAGGENKARASRFSAEREFHESYISAKSPTEQERGYLRRYPESLIAPALHDTVKSAPIKQSPAFRQPPPREPRKSIPKQYYHKYADYRPVATSIQQIRRWVFHGS